MQIDIYYDPAQRQTDIFCNAEKTDTARIAGTSLPEWLMPFQLKGIRWLGICEELRKLAGEEAFTVRYHGPEEAYKVLAETLTATGIQLDPPDLQKAPVSDQESLPAEQTVPVQPAEPESPPELPQSAALTASKPRLTRKQAMLLGACAVSAVLLTVFLIDLVKTRREYQTLRQQSAELKAESLRQSTEQSPAQTEDSKSEETGTASETASAAAASAGSAESAAETTVQTETADAPFSPVQLLNMTAGEIQEKYACKTEECSQRGMTLRLVSDSFPDVWPLFNYQDNMTIAADEKPIVILVNSGSASENIAVGMKTNELVDSAGKPDRAYQDFMEGGVVLEYQISDALLSVYSDITNDTHLFFGDDYEIKPDDAVSFLKSHRATVTSVTIRSADTQTAQETSEPVEPAEPAEPAWKAEYIQTLSGAGGVDPMYSLYDVNSDGIPELFLSEGSEHSAGCSVYTFREGRLVRMMFHSYASDGVDTLGANGMLCASSSYGMICTGWDLQGYHGSQIYTMSGDSFEIYADFSYDEQTGEYAKAGGLDELSPEGYEKLKAEFDKIVSSGKNAGRDYQLNDLSPIRDY